MKYLENFITGMNPLIWNTLAVNWPIYTQITYFDDSCGIYKH